MTTTVFAMLAVGVGLALVVAGLLARTRDRDKALAEILELPYGERDVRVESLTENYNPLVEGTIGLAGRMVSQFDTKGAMSRSLERARIPLRPGEYVLVTLAGALVLAALLLGLTGTWTGSCRPSASSRPSAASWPTCSTCWPTSSGPARRCAGR